MKTVPLVACVAALVVSGFSRTSSVVSGFSGTQEKMTTYQLVLLTKGPAAATVSTPAGQVVVKEHIAHIYKLGADGKGMAAGPFTDGGEIQGLIIMKAASPEQAREWEAADPGVKAGIFSMDVLPFLSPEGWFGTWGKFGEFETVYFGFLNRGLNRGQDAETAKRLQEEHLRYMEGQSKEGKLIVAGPFMVDTPRRGIVIYRVASMDEAKQRAEADPMVKAGRLAVELHPWQVPTGALPKLPK
jgi:uncharacterized protein